MCSFGGDWFESQKPRKKRTIRSHPGNGLEWQSKRLAVGSITHRGHEGIKGCPWLLSMHLPPFHPVLWATSLPVFPRKKKIIFNLPRFCFCYLQIKALLETTKRLVTQSALFSKTQKTIIWTGRNKNAWCIKWRTQTKRQQGMWNLKP